MNKWITGCFVALFAVACAQEPVPESTSPAPRMTSTVIPTAPPTPSLESRESFDGDRAFEHAVRQMEFGPRPTGSQASAATAEYISDTLTSVGWSAEYQEFEYRGVQARNIIAKNSDSAASVAIIAAHYDTRRVADQDPEGENGVGVPGANDGASGVAVLLELARVLDQDHLSVPVWLVFFDAEDNGRLEGWNWHVGATYFVDNLATTPSYAIIVDMIGDKDQEIYYEGFSDEELKTELWTIADDLGYRDYFIPEVRHHMTDDHTPFLLAGIPAVDIIDFDYPYWHTSGDTIDKISPDSLERVGRVIEEFLEIDGAGERE